MSKPEQKGATSQIIQVTVDCTGYPNSTPGITCNPANAQMAPGTDTITWNLNPQNVPNGYTVRFANQTQDSLYGIALSGADFTNFTQNDDTQCTVTDNNQDTQKTDYPYNVNVVVVPSEGKGVLFRHDPDVENEPGT